MYYVETEQLHKKLELLKKKTYLIHKLKLESYTRQDLVILAQIVLTFSQKQLEVLENKLVKWKNYNPLVRLLLTNHLKEVTTLAKENLYKSINPERNRKLVHSGEDQDCTIGSERFELKVDLEHGIVNFEPIDRQILPVRFTST